MPTHDSPQPRPGARSGLDATDSLRVLERKPDESAANWAYRTLEHGILMMFMPPGSWLRETAVSERLGVSRTPVREAIGLLRDRGLVEVAPKSASHVTRIDVDAVRQGCFLRSAVEPLVLQQLVGAMDRQSLAALSANIEAQRLAIQEGQAAARLVQLDDEFHHHLYRAARKELVWDAVRKATGQFDRVRYLGLLSGLEVPSPDAHQQIYEILAFGGHQTRAELTELMDRHLGNYLGYLGRLIHAYPSYFALT